MKWFVIAALFLSGTVSSLFFLQRPATVKSESTPTGGSRKAVVVELFTSEGCSSCPPADDLLRKLVATQPVPGVEIVALGEHVDYWNQLGWNDPFSSELFSRRQHRYAQRFEASNVYTPQAVVGGTGECLGSNRSAIISLVENAARATTTDVSIALKPGETGRQPLEVHVSGLPRRGEKVMYDVLLAITEDNLTTDVRRGENGGRTLTHAPVTRRVVPLGTVNGEQVAVALPATVELDPKWNRENLRFTAFIQEKTDLRIVGAATLKLDGAPASR
jgi:hypothetical protein